MPRTGCKCLHALDLCTKFYDSTILHHVFMLVRSSSAVFAFLSESETKVADLSGLHSESGEIRDLRDPSPVPWYQCRSLQRPREYSPASGPQSNSAIDFYMHLMWLYTHYTLNNVDVKFHSGCAMCNSIRKVLVHCMCLPSWHSKSHWKSLRAHVLLLQHFAERRNSDFCSMHDAFPVHIGHCLKEQAQKSHQIQESRAMWSLQDALFLTCDKVQL